MANISACGYCRGSGQVPGRKHDVYGYRPDYPDLVPCGYCNGSGQVEDGDRLLPARLAAKPEAYGKEVQRQYRS